jgi:hypothetical protein
MSPWLIRRSKLSYKRARSANPRDRNSATPYTTHTHRIVRTIALFNNWKYAKNLRKWIIFRNFFLFKISSLSHLKCQRFFDISSLEISRFGYFLFGFLPYNRKIQLKIKYDFWTFYYGSNWILITLSEIRVLSW